VYTGVHRRFESGEHASETQQYENRLSRITFMKGQKSLEETLDKSFYHFFFKIGCTTIIAEGVVVSVPLYFPSSLQSS
jgi:hypothetical protein